MRFQFKLSTRGFVEANRNLFEEVSKKYKNMKNIHNVEYTILNYEKILSEMCDFVEGYITYSTKEDKKYKDKVLSITKNFYNTMFTDPKYRKRIVLEDFVDISKSFLEGTKKLQTIMESCLESEYVSYEMKSLITMTDNQYKKVSKVYKDDMNIYLWLNSYDSKFFKHCISDSTRRAFADRKTPVMHKVPKSANPPIRDDE